jgi:WhiB family redox-sensing transcriptional regulator
MKANEEDKEVGAMTVLYSELQVAGWADQYIGLEDVTYTSDDSKAFTLPCHNSDPDLFFADSELEISMAKSLCGGCPMKLACLEGAKDRNEPCGVWGGELIEDGVVIERKRRPGRPARQIIAA